MSIGLAGPAPTPMKLLSKCKITTSWLCSCPLEVVGSAPFKTTVTCLVSLCYYREEDLLDLAPFLAENSRLGEYVYYGVCVKSLISLDGSLAVPHSCIRYACRESCTIWTCFFNIYFPSLSGCQIILTKEMDGIELVLPKATRNFYVDGHVPQPHWWGCYLPQPVFLVCCFIQPKQNRHAGIHSVWN